MRCKTCDYPLWNLTSRICPECGEKFLPSEFEFVRDRVQFCCPHCDQPYYGTDEHGRLSPVIFDCAKCGKHIHMDETILRPAEGATDQMTRADRMPWFERQDRGLIRSWFSSMKWAMVEPNRLIRAVPEDGGAGGAWFFATVNTIIFLTTGIALPWIALSLMQSVGIGGVPLMWAVGGPLIGYGAGIILLGICIYLWPLVTHLVLRMTGAVKHPLRRTCHAVYYSSSANVLTAVPCCGLFIGFVWWMVSAINMVKQAQNVHGGRAALAVLVCPIVSAVLAIVAYFIFITVMLSMLLSAGMMGAMPGGPAISNETSIIVQEIVSYRWTGNSQPVHASELLLFSSFGRSMTFVESNTATTEADVPLGDGTFADFAGLSRREQFKAIQTEIDKMPQGVIAHRFGDFVFTYHGASLGGWDSNLWVVVMIPDPDINGTPASGDPIYLGTADYGVRQITYAELAAELTAQNQHRATLGLPPLPDLLTVTHGSPATQKADDDGE